MNLKLAKNAVHLIIYTTLLNAGISRGDSKVTKELLVPLKTELTFKDPVDLDLLEEWDVFRAVHDKLFITESGDGSTNGSLAKGWVYSGATKSLTITLKEGLQFSDGRSLNIDDVIFSIKRKMHLTYDSNPNLPKCLGVTSAFAKFLPAADISTLKLLNPHALQFSLGECDQGILEELAGTNFAIVDKNATDSLLKLKSNASVSGPFTAKQDGRDFILTPNPRNWRYAKLKSEPAYRIRFIPLKEWAEKVKSASPFPQASFLRTDDIELVNKLQKQGYKLRYSLPSTSIFLTLVPENPGNTSILETQTISYINHTINRTALISRLKSNLYLPSDALFTKDMNCNPEVNESKLPAVRQRPNSTIVLTSNGDSPVGGLTQEVASDLRQLGFEVEVMKSSEALTRIKKPKQVAVQLRGQHLSLRPLEVMNLMVGQLKAVPDPAGEVARKIHESLGKTNKIAAAKEVYQFFHQRNFIPLAHRRNAYLASDEKYLDIYSTSSGNMFLENLIPIMDGSL